MPPRLTYPGVYVQEQSSGVRTIAGVSTSTALVVGMARRGPLGRPTKVLSIDQYQQTFGDDITYGEMTAQVRQFFLNGGTEAIIVRAADTTARQAEITLTTEAGTGASGAANALTLRARDAGTLGDELRAIVDYGTVTPELTFNIEIFRRAIDENGAVVISDNEFFGNLSMDPASPRFATTIIDAQSALVTAVSAAAPGVGDRGFSQSGLVLTGTGAVGGNAADDTAALATITALVGSGSRIRVRLGQGSPVTATLPDAAAGLNAWLMAATGAINGALTSATQPGSVSVGVSAFATGRCLRITAVAADNGQSVVVTPAATGDGSAALQFGNAAGGVEIGAFSRFRPAPSGFVTRINQAVTSGFGQNTGLSRLAAFAQETRANVVAWSFDEGTGGAPIASPANVSYPAGGTSFLEGAANSDGIGSLRNTAQHLDALAASLGSGLGTAWSVSRFGLRIAIRPTTGDSNFGLAAELSTSDGGGGGTDLGAGVTGIATAAQAQNTAAYALGTSGATRRQTGGVGGDNGGVPQLADYQAIFDTVEEEVDLFNMMFLPRGEDQTDANRSLLWGEASVRCQRERAFLLVDPPSDSGAWGTAQAVETGISDRRLGLVTDHAGIYWPRLTIASRPTAVDPCGTVAGIIARTDTRRGVWKAPAGLEATTLGATGFEHMVSDAQNGLTNPQAVNTLRQFAAGGAVWGARTMAGFDNSGENDYKYVPVRRTALFIEESLYRGLRFAVFEPNDEPLWAQIRLAAGAFMQNLFRQGAFQGAKKTDAYDVRCDETTTTQNDINLGRVNVVVAFAPLRPAEFVVLTVRQLAGQVDV